LLEIKTSSSAITEKIDSVYICSECMNVSIFKADAEEHERFTGHNGFKKMPLQG
jgi:hypothetical protein